MAQWLLKLTVRGVLSVVHRHARALTLLVYSGGLREFESRAELIHCLFEPPTTHGDAENDNLRGDRPTEKGEVLVTRLRHAHKRHMEGLDSTQNMLQT